MSPVKRSTNKTNWLVNFSSFFFSHWRLTLIIWLLVSLGGLVVYDSLIKREGFPPVQFPVSFVSGTYFVDDANQVDKEIVQPLLSSFESVAGIKETQTSASRDFFSLVVIFEDDVEPQAGRDKLVSAAQSANLPPGLDIDYQALEPAGFLNSYDLLLSVYSYQPASAQQLDQVAIYVANQLNSDPQLTNASPQFLQSTSVDPDSGQPQTRQVKFNQLGLLTNGQPKFYPAITIGLDRDASSDMDIIEFSAYVDSRLSQIDLSRYGNQFNIQISADLADSVSNQIEGLESNLASGLLAVTIISLILISWRAALTTALFMFSVMLVSILILYLLGITLNTISLFALVLALGLFVDDATIVVEAIEANRRRVRKPIEAVKTAVKRVGSASFAGTMTTVLVFLPMLFVGGILGDFIRILPVTVIVALISSLVLSLSLIPFLSRFTILANRKLDLTSPVARAEQYISKALANRIRRLKQPKQGRYFALAMLVLSLVMVLAAGAFAQKLSFNIFPANKDSDQLSYQLEFPAGYDLDQAQAVAAQANQLVGDILATDLVRAVYLEANQRRTDVWVELTSFKTSRPTAPRLATDIQTAFNQHLPADVASKAAQINPGPPVSEFPFQVQVFEDDADKALSLASQVRDYLDGASLSRINGKGFNVTKTRLPQTDTVVRYDAQRAVVVQAGFDGDDVSALLVATEDYVKQRFTTSYLEDNGYSADSLGFDFGAESDNADSFQSLSYIFPLALLMMFILLAVQFKSALQPLLVFLAIPFTLLGVTAALYYSNNAFSFFVQLGLVGLIGIAVNNTILLTDYANQAKRAGSRTIEAVALATEQRFRPLVATSLTTMMALLPLALSSPFWEALSLTIIFGLLSSTILVILAFPYYYLLAEWLRQRFSVRQGLIILVEISLLIIGLIYLPLVISLVAIISLIGLFVYQKYVKV